MPGLRSSEIPRQHSTVPASALTLARRYPDRGAVFWARGLGSDRAGTVVFVLTPFVSFLQHWYFPRIVAVLVVGLCAFSMILERAH
jgi:hypothetical protein